MERFPTEKELETMSLEELKKECKIWRNLWSWLPDNVKYMLLSTGKLCRVVRRDYHGFKGFLGQCYWELKEIEIEVKEKIYSYEEGKYYLEEKVVKIPVTNVVNIEFISDLMEMDEEYKELEETLDKELSF